MRACKGPGARAYSGPAVELSGRAATPVSGRSSGVEHNLAKVGVGRSNRLARSIFPGMMTNAAQGVSDLGHVFRALG